MPSALGVPHSYFGQQVAGSVATIFAQAHAGAAHAVPVPPVPVGDVVLAARTQVGQWYAGQQVVGSTPSLIGVAPSGQAIAIAGQMAARGSQVGVLGAHLPSQI